MQKLLHVAYAKCAIVLDRLTTQPESCEIQELCRNCKARHGNLKTPEQEHDITCRPLCSAARVIYVVEVFIEKETYVAVDAIPEWEQARAEVRQHAWQTVALRQAQVMQGEEAQVPLAVDALSTAERVLEAKNQCNYDSAVYVDRLEGLRLDCRRLVAEWYRKLRPEYFPASRHFFDAETGDFYSHGVSTRQMTENALRPVDNNPEETERRVNEKVENETATIVRKLGGVALGGVAVRTISQCTDKAIADYEFDQLSGNQHRGYDGYVPEIQKLMIRDMRFDPETGDRLEEQIGLPGLLINHFVIQEALRRRQIETRGMDKTQLHGHQLLAEDDLIDFVQLLDEVAAEEWRTELRGMTVFMGEEVPLNAEKDYSGIRSEAAQRQEQLEDTAATVTNFILDLAEDQFDKRKAPAHIEEFVKLTLLNLAKKDVRLAKQMFNEQTYNGLKEVMYLESIGDQQAAFKRMEQVWKDAPGGGYCSGGSCGLEGVNTHTAEGQNLLKNLRAETGDTVVRDKERACRCGKKSIVYAYNSSKVNKYCESCKAFESKKTSVKINEQG